MPLSLTTYVTTDAYNIYLERIYADVHHFILVHPRLTYITYLFSYIGIPL